MKRFAVGLLALGLAASPAAAQEKLKVGFISTLSGASSVLGQHMLDGFMLSVDHAGGKLGGLETEIIKGDDQFKPDVGVKLAREMAERDKVNFVTGFVFSNVLVASVKPLVDNQIFVLSGNAGPSALAGERCSPYYFAVAYQNDMADETMGHYFNAKGYKRVYLMAPNYVAGRDILAGFKRTFKGEVLGEVYTRMDQQDYQAEIDQMRAAKPDAAYVFYPGGFGINFIKQFHQTGARKDVRLYSKATVDLTNLPALGEAALGSFEPVHWNIDFDNPASTKFVGDFIKKYNYAPSIFAQASYDSGLLIDNAVRAVKGRLSDKEGIRKALEAANIKSPRGDFKFNTNHHPIHKYHLVEAVKTPGGITLATREPLTKDPVRDSYAAKCSMK